MRAYLDGRGATAGSQSLRAVLYADSAGTPGSRLATSSAVTINAGRAAGWVIFTLPATVSLQAGIYYWVGLHSGTADKISRFAGTSVASALRWNLDAYSDGPSSPFGAVKTDSTQLAAFATGG